jgi:hypothetical protein
VYRSARFKKKGFLRQLLINLTSSVRTATCTGARPAGLRRRHPGPEECGLPADISAAIRGSLTAAMLTDFGAEYANSTA